MGKDTMNCFIVKRHEEIFKAISQKMKEADGVERETECAEQMRKEVGAILKCEKFTAASPECKQCHITAESRRNAVKLIMKAQKFERENGADGFA